MNDRGGNSIPLTSGSSKWEKRVVTVKAVTKKNLRSIVAPLDMNYTAYRDGKVKHNL